MGEYTALTLVGIVAVVALELLWARTGIFRSGRYWVSIAIMVFFQIWVDGWLTKLSAPIVIYAPEQFAGIRFPWDIPIEDFGFGFVMLTLTIICWIRLAPAGPDRRSRTAGPPAPGPRSRHDDAPETP
ncbi:lycopene cyclase domain-containing protein [Salana multivorans]